MFEMLSASGLGAATGSAAKGLVGRPANNEEELLADETTELEARERWDKLRGLEILEEV